MTGILFRYVSNYRLFHKEATCNKTREMINFAIGRSNERFVRSKRNLSPIINVQRVTQPKLFEKLSIANDYITMHNFLFKKHVDNIIDLIDNPNSVSRDQVHLLLQWCNAVIDCLPSEKVELMKSLWSILTICNFEKYNEHYNVRLKIYVENEYDFSPSKIFMEMKNDGLSPDHFTYLTCMKHYCMKGNINEALILMRDMKLQCIVPEFAYNLLMLGYSQSGDIQAVNKVLSTIKLEGIMLTTESYAPILYTYAKVNQIDNTIGLIETCNSNNIHFTNKHILDIIYILAINNHKKHIDTMLGHLKKKMLISAPEINVILKLANSNEMRVAVSALSFICSNSKCPQFNNIMKLILKQTVDKNKVIYEVTTLCMASQNTVIFTKLLSTALWYALQKGSSSSLLLLKTCKYYFRIKPHFFWPLLIKEANQYDLEGIFNILEIMVNEFDVLPCVDTIVDYVLPFCFGNIQKTIHLLRRCKLNDITIDNSYVKFLLKKRKLKFAAAYVHTYQTKYFYKLIAHDLRHAFLLNSDIHNFVYISRNLVEHINPNSEHLLVPVSMDKQLHDYMIDFPGCKTYLIKILKQLQQENVSLSNETVRRIASFLNGYTTDEVVHVLHMLTNKEV